MTRVVVVTGVGRQGQLGEAVAQAFAAEGATVHLIDRDAGELAARVEELRAAGRAAEGHPCDLTDADAVHDTAARIEATAGRIDAVACLAGGFAMSGPIGESAVDTWQRMWAINATTAWCTARAFTPALRRTRGAIVFVASASVLPGGRVAEMSAYAASKAGVLALMQAVAQEEKGVVRANAIAPTAIRTAANLASMDDGTAWVEREVVAGWITHLCGPGGANATGQVIRLA